MFKKIDKLRIDTHFINFKVSGSYIQKIILAREIEKRRPRDLAPPEELHLAAECYDTFVDKEYYIQGQSMGRVQD